MKTRCEEVSGTQIKVATSLFKKGNNIHKIPHNLDLLSI